MKHKHLTFSERLSIENDLGLSLFKQSFSFHKNCTTISKKGQPPIFTYIDCEYEQRYGN